MTIQGSTVLDAEKEAKRKELLKAAMGSKSESEKTEVVKKETEDESSIHSYFLVKTIDNPKLYIKKKEVEERAFEGPMFNDPK